MPEPICLAFTGASGMPYGVRLLECLLAAGCRVQLLYSQVAQIVARQEIGLDLPARASDARRCLEERYPALPGRLEVYGREEWFAPLASGSNPPGAMVICPCSMGTLAAIAQGLASKLIERAADVVLKEGRKLILVPRETPLSAIHLENMLRLVASRRRHPAPQSGLLSPSATRRGPGRFRRCPHPRPTAGPAFADAALGRR
jgi:4-hydroxy-3-polyprenylbenzoate decarboxylase